MISASLIPYKAGFCHVTIDGVRVASFEVGSVPGRPLDGTYTAGLKRLVTDHDLDALAHQVLRELEAREVESVHIVAPGKRSDIAWRVARRIGEAIDPSLISATDHPTAPVQEAPPEVLPPKLIPVGEGPAGGASCVGVLIDSAAREGEAGSAGESAVSFSPPCICGIDPGTHWLGVVVVDSSGHPVKRYTLEVGREIQLPRPVKIVRANGEQYERTTKRIMPLEDVVTVASAVLAIVQSFGVTRVVIEWVEHGRIFGKNQAEITSRATGLVRAQFLAGTIHGLLRATKTIAVQVVTNATWVAAVTKTRTAKGRRAKIAPIVEARFPELIGANEHERDAAGIVMWATAPVPKDEPQRDPGERKTRTADPNRRWERRNKRRDTERRAARDAAGCTCTSRRHRRGCPLFVAMRYKTKDADQEVVSG